MPGRRRKIRSIFGMATFKHASLPGDHPPAIRGEKGSVRRRGNRLYNYSE